VRICFLVCAHDRPAMLERTLASLASPRHLCVAHIDAKTQDPAVFAVLEAAAQRMELHQAPRVSVTWGDFSQVLGEVSGIRTALAQGDWDYLVYLSGVDLLVRPLHELEAWLTAADGRSFMDRRPIAGLEPALRARIRKRTRWLFTRRGERLVRLPIPMDLLPGYRPEFYGSSWHILHRSMCEYGLKVLDGGRLPVRLRHAYCPDEFFWQCVVGFDPAMAARVQPGKPRYDIFHGKPNPKWLTMEDRPAIEASGQFLARKFDVAVDAEVVDHYVRVAQSRA
jgi:hypothetical protein